MYFQVAIFLFKYQSLHGITYELVTNLKSLQTLIHTEKTREPIINEYMAFHLCIAFLYRQQGV